MVETLPMLEHDPRPAYRWSRLLRVLAFSFVTSAVLVVLLIVLVRFVWDEFLADLLGRGPYNSNPIFVVPSIGIIAAILAKLLWDQAEGRQARGPK